MRVPLAPAGRREMAIITLLFGGVCVSALVLAARGYLPGWPIAGIFGVAWLAGIAFFRDPHRQPPDDDAALVAPADGKVVETAKLADHEDIAGPASRISIFLSVFDVHVNRSPCAGRVRAVRYQPGQYLDARNPESGRLNEANTIIIDPEPPHTGPIVVRQIAGLIARRIVCDLKPGDRLVAGQRIGLIKFGSRTELIVPGHVNYQTAVAIGDRVRGAETVMARRTAARRDAVASKEPAATQS